jgi:hypothetical protein
MQISESYNNLFKNDEKYKEWINKGSYFGHSNSIKKIFKDTPYKYYDMNGNIVNISSISKKYRNDCINIPIFNQFIEEDKTFVQQGRYKIVKSYEILTTTGIATCSALGIIFGDEKLLVHLDSSIGNLYTLEESRLKNFFDNLNIELPLYDNIMVNIIKDKIKLLSDTKAYIYSGCFTSFNSISIKKAKKICLLLGITNISFIQVESIFDIITI